VFQSRLHYQLALGAVISASNDHSPGQAMIYDKANIFYLGKQYYPTPLLDNIINADSRPARLFNKDKAFQAEFISASENSTVVAGQMFGFLGNDLNPEGHLSEFRNVLARLTTTP